MHNSPVKSEFLRTKQSEAGPHARIFINNQTRLKERSSVVIVTLKSRCCRLLRRSRRPAVGRAISAHRLFPPKRAQAMARRLAIGRRMRRRRSRKAAGFPANNAKWCICQGEFVHRRRSAPHTAPLAALLKQFVH